MGRRQEQDVDLDKLLGEIEADKLEEPVQEPSGGISPENIDELIANSAVIKELQRELSAQRKEISEIVEKYSQTVQAINELKEVMASLVQSLQHLGNSNNGQQQQQLGGANLLNSLAPLLQVIAAGAQGGTAAPEEDTTVRAMRSFVEVFKLFNDMQISMAKAQAEIRKSWSSLPSGGTGKHMGEAEG